MNKPLRHLLAAILVVGACAPAKEIETHDAWMRAMPQGENGAVYFILHNHASMPDELIGASSNSAEAVEFHESIATDDGVVRMRGVASIPLKAYGEVEFAPGSYHLMLVRLSSDVPAGDAIEITLHFRAHPDMRVRVQAVGAAVPAETHENH